MLKWLKKLWAPRTGPELEYEHREPTEPASTLAGPPTSGFATAAPLEKPVPEEPDRQP